MTQKHTRSQKKTVITPARRVGRFFGYSGIFLVWVFLLLVILGLLAAIPISIIADASSNGGLLSASPGIVNLQQNIGEALLAIVIVVPLMGMVFGYGVIYMLFTAAVINVLLSATYIGRSLNPKYRNEPLSFTKLVEGTIDPRYAVAVGTNPAPLFSVARTSAIGAILAGVSSSKTAISLLPVRATPVTGFLGKLSLIVWSTASIPLIIPMSLIGTAYIVTVIWTLWPVTSVSAMILWSCVSGVLFGFGLYLTIREMRKLLIEPKNK